MIEIVRGDITRLEVDAIVDAANEALRGGEEGSIRTLAFPAISTGVYGFPKAAAARIAVRVMRKHESEFERIVACLFDEENERLYRAALEGAA